MQGVQHASSSAWDQEENRQETKSDDPAARGLLLLPCHEQVQRWLRNVRYACGLLSCANAQPGEVAPLSHYFRQNPGIGHTMDILKINLLEARK